MADYIEIDDVTEQPGPEIMEISDDETATTTTSEHQRPRAVLYNLPVPPLIMHPSFNDLQTSLHAFSREHGYELVIRRTKGNPVWKRYYFCKRHGVLDNQRQLTEETCIRKRAVSIKTRCNFRLVATAVEEDAASGSWYLSSGGHGCDVHNHPADHSLQLPGHRRRDRTDAIKESIIVMHRCAVKPTKIQAVLRELYGDRAIVLQDIKNVISSYRAESLTVTTSIATSTGTSTITTATTDDDEASSTDAYTYTMRQSSTTVLFQKFDKMAYIHREQIDPTTGQIQYLLMIHPTSLALYKEHPDVLVLDCTYKTNRYNQPLCNIAGTTGANKTVTLGIALMISENEDAYSTLLRDLRDILGKLKAATVRTAVQVLVLING